MDHEPDIQEVTEEELSARRMRCLADKDYVTGRVGESCRYIGFGLVAVFYTIATSDGAFPKELWINYDWWILAFGSLGALTVLFDYVQYLAGDFSARLAMKRDDAGHNSYLYDKKWLSYRLRSAAYVIKQLCTLLGAVILTYVMIISLF